MKLSKSKAQAQNKKKLIDDVELSYKIETRFRLFQLSMIAIAILVGLYFASSGCHCNEKKVLYDFKLVDKEYEPMYRYEKKDCEVCKQKGK